MKKDIIFRLAKKEFFGYINSPLAYTIIVPFLLLSVFIYIRIALVAGEANLRPYFQLLPWFLLLLAPAISMKLLTEEHKTHTLELLFAHPLSEGEIVLGKFFGALAFFTAILLTTISLPLTLIIWSRPDIGQIIGQYLGGIFIGAAFLAIGLTASAYVQNPISGFLLGAAVSFIFVIIGLDFITQLLPAPFNLLVTELSVITHGENIARGLLDIRDLAYFFTLTSLCLAVTVFKLAERKTLEDPVEKRKLHLAIGLIITIGFLANIFLSYYPLRLDLTQARLFTLSAGTKETIKNLPDIVNITVFRSHELPAQMQIVARDTIDLLKDYQKLSHQIRIRIVYPEDSPEARSESQSAGIQEVQFNRLGAGKFEVQSGMLGLSIRYGEKTETIPFIADSSDLEYQLTRRIRKLTSEKEPVVGIKQTGYSNNQLLGELLRTQYQTKYLSESDSYSPQELAALIIIDDGFSSSTDSSKLKNYFDQGGSALVMASGVGINREAFSGQKSNSAILSAFKDYGLIINQDVVYDLQLAEILAFTGSNNQRYLASYPYWLRSLPATNDFPPLANIKSIALGWPSSLKMEAKEGVNQKKLLVTGESAGRLEDSFSISPQGVENLTPKEKNILLGAALEKDKGRVVVIGTSTLADDQFLRSSQDNVAFLSNTIDYLTADKDLASIPSKTSGRAIFEFRSPTDIYLAQYGNLLLPPLAVTLFAIFHLRKRRNLAQRVYER